MRRLRGELLWRRGAPLDEVEHQLTVALELARRRSAHSLALRAAVTLAELRLEHGRGEEARGQLDAELGPFTRVDAAGDAGVPRALALLQSES